jgi:hypothetical protein
MALPPEKTGDSYASPDKDLDSFVSVQFPSAKDVKRKSFHSQLAFFSIKTYRNRHFTFLL